MTGTSQMQSRKVGKGPKTLGKITKKYWVKPSGYVNILENEAKVKKRKESAQSMIDAGKDVFVIIPPSYMIQRIAETAEQIIKFKPTAIVAIDKRGVLPARLVQHYVKQKLGSEYRQIPVYIVQPKERELWATGRNNELKYVRQGDPTLLNPELEENLKKEGRIAIIDDGEKTGVTLRHVEKFLKKQKTAEKNEIHKFPILEKKYHVVRMCLGENFISPSFLTSEYIKKNVNPNLDVKTMKKAIENERHSRFAAYQLYRDMIDEYIKKQKRKH